MGFSVEGNVFSQIFSAPASKLYIQPPNGLEVHECAQGPLITMPNLVGVGLHPTPWQPNMLTFCLCVCLSVTLLNDRVCAHNFATKALKYRNNFDTVGLGLKVCSCALAVNTTKRRSPKTGKIWGHFASRGRENKLIETEFGT